MVRDGRVEDWGAVIGEDSEAEEEAEGHGAAAASDREVLDRGAGSERVVTCQCDAARETARIAGAGSFY